MAMHFGGGYLDRKHWLCWHRTQFKRLLLKLGVKVSRILKMEDFSEIKCFHAGGEAKWWLANDAYLLQSADHQKPITTLAGFKPFVELRPSEYRSLQRSKAWLRKLGYYSVLGDG
jgi:hypothetical protein